MALAVGATMQLAVDERFHALLKPLLQLRRLFVGELAVGDGLVDPLRLRGDELLDEPGTAKRAVSVLLANLIHRRVAHLAQSAPSGSAS